MQNFRKIELVLGLLIVILLMSTPMFNPLCRGETKTLKTIQLPFQVGDMLFMDYNGDIDFVIGNYNDHCVICVDILEDAVFVSAGENEGVHYTTFSNLEEDYENFLIARVKNVNQEQIAFAVDWAEKRINDSYQDWLELPYGALKCNDPNDNHSVANKWYCSELLWAAYYNIDPDDPIDIDNNGWDCYPIPFWPYVSMGCPELFHVLPEWMKPFLCFPYFFKNEILIDSDVEATYKTDEISGLPAGTKIQIWGGGTMSIENVQAGSVVVSYNIGQDQIVPAIVEDVYYYPPVHLTDNFIVINDDFQVTDNHELYVNDWWMFAKDVQVGDKLLVYSNGNLQNVTVVTLEAVTENIGGYALELDSSLGVLASYFADDILVCE